MKYLLAVLFKWLLIFFINFFRAFAVFFLVVILYFWDIINDYAFKQFYDYFYEKIKIQYPKPYKIVALYFSTDTFERLQRRYLKEFYFLEKFFCKMKIKYFVLTDKNLNMLSKDVDLLVVSDARYIPISTILSFIDYAQNGGKILFTYQSLMFNRYEKKYGESVYRNFGLYDIVFDNRKFDYFSFKHFTKILLSRKYSVVFYTDKSNVLGYTSNDTPFLVKYKNFYFLSENTFCIENLLNSYIIKFNVYLLNLLLKENMDDKYVESFEKEIRQNYLEIVMPIEYIIANPKTKKYFYFSKKMNHLYRQLANAYLYKENLNKNEKFLKIGLSKVNLKQYNLIKIFEYKGKNFFILLKNNLQGGLEEYLSFRISKIVSWNPVVIEISLEDYICSVVSSEMPDNFNLEALKAQAVTARTYAIKNINRHGFFDLCDKPHCQNFEGERQENFKSFVATYLTLKEIIVYKGKPINAVYHSTCGGITADSEDVWDSFIPYLRKTKDYQISMDEAYCKQSRLFKWKVEMEKSKADKILKKTIPYIIKEPYIGNIKNIKIVKNKSLRVEKMIIETNKRRYVSYKENSIYLFSEDLYFSMLPSNFIDKIEIKGEKIIFYGRGFGHGVGMCQFGANTLAKKISYKKIIEHYYKNVQISKIRE